MSDLSESKEMKSHERADMEGGYSPPIQPYHAFVEKYIKDKPGKLLEVGCGEGKFLKQFDGIDATGLEIDKKLAERARASGLKIVVTDASEGIPFPDSSFDYVVCLETIAHIVDSDRFLKECHRVLKPDGVMFLETVNSANWRYRLQYLFAIHNNYELFYGKVVGKSYSRYREIVYPEHKMIHLHHYSVNSIKMILREKGFEVEDWSYKLSKLGFWPNLLAPQIFFKCSAIK